MMREDLLFAVDIGSERKEYKKTFLSLSKTEEYFKAFSVCRESLKVRATDVRVILRSVLEPENTLRCLFACGKVNSASKVSTTY